MKNGTEIKGSINTRETKKNGFKKVDCQSKRKVCLKKPGAAVSCLKPMDNGGQDFMVDVRERQTKAKKVKQNPRSSCSGLDELVRLIKLQNRFPEHLLLGQDAEKGDLNKELFAKDPAARDLVIQLNHRKPYLMNSSRIKGVE